MQKSNFAKVALPMVIVALAWILGGTHLTAMHPAETHSLPFAPLDRDDPDLQARLERTLEALGLEQLVTEQRLAVALVNLSKPGTPRYAGVNDDVMMYAASLPKLAILLAAFEEIETGELADTPELRQTLNDMIRFSSNEAATRAIEQVGFYDIADCIEQPRYQLYDRYGSGGLWVGKAYAPTPAVARDPLSGLAHAATARQAARFFVLLDQGRLVSPERSEEMLEILRNPGINHKFVKGLESRPGVEIYRKSGSWRHWHSDAALIERNGQRYVAAALVEDANGSEILERLILALDELIQSDPPDPH